MADDFEPPIDFGVTPLDIPAPAPAMPPASAPPTLQSFLPQQGMAGRLAPLAVLAAALIGGKKMNGLAQGYSQGAHQMGQDDLHKAQLLQQDALRNQQMQQVQQHQQAVMQQQEEARRMQALNTIKANVSKITDAKQYDQAIDAYASQMQMAGFRGVTSNQLRVAAPFVAPSAKSIAAAAVSAWLKNPANAAALKKDPTIVSKAVIQIDTNGDGIPENVPLIRAGQLGGIQFAADEKGNAIVLEGAKDPKVGSAFQEVFKANLARFVADNKREPDPKEKQTIVNDSITTAKKDAAPADEAPITLSPAGLDAAALNYAKTGTLPPMGMSKASGGTRSKIINRAAELYPGLDVAANKGTFAANETALKDLTKRTTQTEAAARTAYDNLDLALAQSGEVARTGSKLANRYLQWVQGALSPAEGLTQFETYVYTAAREYAKVTSGGAASAQGLTDSAAREASRLLSTAQSPRAFAAAVRAMKADMENVRKNYKLQVSDLQGQMRGAGAPPAEKPPAADAGWMDVGGGIQIRKKQP